MTRGKSLHVFTVDTIVFSNVFDPRLVEPIGSELMED
jgi:hypothetical protein